MHDTMTTTVYYVEFLATIFIWLIGISVLMVIIIFIYDVTQRKHAILRNYPVIGHFRNIFASMGEFFRQYFFAMDREEMPFNRAERSWVYRASKNLDNTIAFGSTKNLNPTGTAIFVNCPFPTLEIDACPTKPIVIGKSCKYPYEAKSIFNVSGMSYGALSRPAILALSKGAALAGCWMNTGEGGVSPHHLKGGADLVFQIGTAKYGVRNCDGTLSDKKLKEVAAIDAVKMFEIKLSQGAKPGKGGILPGIKVTPEIAKIRGIPAGKDSISPNRHVEVNNVNELLDFIEHIKKITQKPTGIKFVFGAYGWLDKTLEEIKRRGPACSPDFLTIDSGDGGTGAAPMPLMDNVGLLVREALPFIVNKLIEHGLRDQIKVIVSGKLITPSEVAWALCAGADFIVSARGFMFALGCIQALKCNKNTCPTGITTHNPRLQKGLDPKDKSVRVASYVKNLVHEVEILAHSCGVTDPRALKRYHVRIMQSNGRSIPFDKLHPYP